MTDHTALADLPQKLTSLGLNVEVADGYDEGQGNYLWTDPDTGQGSYDNPPSGYMVHHTAGSSATPPPHDTSKAGAWIGLKRGDRLYQEGGGIPTVYLASAGPARVSSGYGYRPALWDFTFQDERAPWDALGPDTDTAANRYTFNVETVHRGDGSDIDPGVWEHVVGLGVGLHQMFGWTERTLGHLSWSQRKIDPRWSVGLPNDGNACIIDVQDTIKARLGDEMPPDVPPPRYPDVPYDHIFWEDIEWLAANGITNQPAGSNYGPEDPMTRGQMAAFLHRYDQYLRGSI